MDETMRDPNWENVVGAVIWNELYWTHTIRIGIIIDGRYYMTERDLIEGSDFRERLNDMVDELDREVFGKK